MFQQKVDKRSRTSMINFLDGHCEYEESFAHKVKLHNLGIPSELMDAAYASLGFNVRYNAIRNFEEAWMGGWQGLGVRFAGRSAGYVKLVLTSKNELGYKSVCFACGALNYKEVYTPSEAVLPIVEHLKQGNTVLEPIPGNRFTTYRTQDLMEYWKPKLPLLDNTCGCCGKNTRRNLNNPRYEILDRKLIKPDRCDLEEMHTDDLKTLVNYVQAFDKCIDLLRDEFISLCQRAVASGENFEDFFEDY